MGCQTIKNGEKRNGTSERLSGGGIVEGRGARWTKPCSNIVGGLQWAEICESGTGTYRESRAAMNCRTPKYYRTARDSPQSQSDTRRVAILKRHGDVPQSKIYQRGNKLPHSKNLKRRETRRNPRTAMNCCDRKMNAYPERAFPC